MKNFKTIKPYQLEINPFTSTSKDWMLISSAINADDFNTLTASWGEFGYRWNRDVCNIYIRKHRHTFKYLEKSDHFTVSFFPPSYKEALKICGSISGRDQDKIKKSGLTPIVNNHYIGFEEASINIICKKIYTQDMNESLFIDKTILQDHYPKKDFHRMYTGEIIEIYVK